MFGVEPVEPAIIPIGRGEVLREGSDVLIVGFGPIVARGMAAADALAAEGWSVGVINARFAKPLDRQLILDAARHHGEPELHQALSLLTRLGPAETD